MAKIDWILKPTGEKQMGDEVSHLGGVQRALSHTAHELGAIAKGNLAAHEAEGYSEITVTRGIKLDWFVNLVDKPSKSNKGKPAAAAIEFGNKYGGGGIAPLRNAIGSMRFNHLR
jgi:hypothetical protein